MSVYRYTRLACLRRHETCAAVHDPIIIDDSEDDVSVDYSPLVYAPVTYADYLAEGDFAEVLEPEPYVEDPSEEWEDIGSPELAESCVISESHMSSEGEVPYLACGLCACKMTIHGDLCQACWGFDQSSDRYIEAHWLRVYAQHRGARSDDPIILSDED